MASATASGGVEVQLDHSDTARCNVSAASTLVRDASVARRRAAISSAAAVAFTAVPA